MLALIAIQLPLVIIGLLIQGALIYKVFLAAYRMLVKRELEPAWWEFEQQFVSVLPEEIAAQSAGRDARETRLQAQQRRAARAHAVYLRY